MTIKAQKAVLRREVIARIAAMDREARSTQERRLVDRLGSLPGFAQATTVLMHTSAFPDEVATNSMARSVLDSGKRLICPRVDLGRCGLDLFEINDPDFDLVSGYRAIREPRDGCKPVAAVELDWVLVPGVAFDCSGFRLGRGGGFYDRLIPTLRPDAICWALILDLQWVDKVPREPHDHPVDGVADHHHLVLGSRSIFATGP